VGGIDVTFNAIWIRGDLQGTRLIDMPVDDFTLPILTAQKRTSSLRRQRPDTWYESDPA